MLDGLIDDILTVSPRNTGEIRPDSPQFAPAEMQERRGFSPLSPNSPRGTEKTVSPPPPSDHEEKAILAWLDHIGEDDQILIDETLERCRANLETREYFLMRSREVPATLRITEPDAFQNRVCQECRHWERDTIGDGTGLGACLIDAPRRGLPWPNQDACNQFEEITP